MKREKMSLEKMKGVLSNVLSREEMKEVMAGSGPGEYCGGCTIGACWTINLTGYPYFCACQGNWLIPC